MYLTFLEAVLLILKHASFLCLSSHLDKPALTQAELDYQKADIDLKIQQYLRASSSEHSVEESAHFIMATDIGLFILIFFKIISHQDCNIYLALNKTEEHEEE